VIRKTKSVQIKVDVPVFVSPIRLSRKPVDDMHYTMRAHGLSKVERFNMMAAGMVSYAEELRLPRSLVLELVSKMFDESHKLRKKL
jgi:hypothetical protein